MAVVSNERCEREVSRFSSEVSEEEETVGGDEVRGSHFRTRDVMYMPGTIHEAFCISVK